MNLQLLSDVHLEFYRGEWRTFTDTLDPSGVDVLVLAGDIATRGELLDVLSFFCGAYPSVIYVPGNHEFYGSSPDEIEGLLRQAADARPNLHVLNPGVVEIEGVKFVGAPLWFPRPGGKVLEAGKWGLADYSHIRGFEPWVYNMHEKCKELILAEARSADVVITHHLPSNICTAPRFRGSELDHFFCYDMSDFIEKSGIPLWLFGHTHDRMVKQLGSTTLVSNPRGYPPGMTRERCEGVYQPKLVFTVYPKARIAWTAGLTSTYDSNLEERAKLGENLLKSGRFPVDPEDPNYPGGSVWKSREAAEMGCPAGYSPYKILLPTGWDEDVEPEPTEEGFHHLLNTAVILGKC